MKRASGYLLGTLLGAVMVVVPAAGFAQESGTSTPPGQSTMQQPGQSSSAPTASGETQVLIDPGKIYNDKMPTEWIGKQVELQNVMVTDTNDSGNFWVGTGGKQRLLIVKTAGDPTMNALRIKKGDVVTVTGIIQPATTEWAQKTHAEEGSMKDAKGGSGVFLNATNVTVASSTAK